MHEMVIQKISVWLINFSVRYANSGLLDSVTPVHYISQPLAFTLLLLPQLRHLYCFYYTSYATCIPSITPLVLLLLHQLRPLYCFYYASCVPCTAPITPVAPLVLPLLRQLRPLYCPYYAPCDTSITPVTPLALLLLRPLYCFQYASFTPSITPVTPLLLPLLRQFRVASITPVTPLVPLPLRQFRLASNLVLTQDIWPSSLLLHRRLAMYRDWTNQPRCIVNLATTVHSQSHNHGASSTMPTEIHQDSTIRQQKIMFKRVIGMLVMRHISTDILTRIARYPRQNTYQNMSIY